MSGADLQNLVNQVSLSGHTPLHASTILGPRSRPVEKELRLCSYDISNGRRVSGLLWKDGHSLLTGADRILMALNGDHTTSTDESKRATAYHEGGHALVALHTHRRNAIATKCTSRDTGPYQTDLVRTIMPEAQALGITFQLPEQDKGRPGPIEEASADARRLVHSQGVQRHDRRRARRTVLQRR